jgi:hypothetical protein
MTVISLQIVARPISFLQMQFLQFTPLKRDARPERPEIFGRPEFGRRDRMRNTPERECSVLSFYQMGCLAQQLSIGGFDVAAGSRCRCESSGGHCIDRMR